MPHGTDYTNYFAITPQLFGVRVTLTRLMLSREARTPSQEAKGEEAMPHSSGKRSYPAKRGHPGKKAKRKGKGK